MLREVLKFLAHRCRPFSTSHDEFRIGHHRRLEKDIQAINCLELKASISSNSPHLVQPTLIHNGPSLLTAPCLTLMHQPYLSILSNPSMLTVIYRFSQSTFSTPHQRQKRRSTNSRPSSLRPAHSLWTSSARAASPSQPSSAMLKQSSSVPGARKCCASRRAARHG